MALGYRVTYWTEPERNRRSDSGRLRLRMMIAASLFVFTVLVRVFWADGTAVLRNIFTDRTMSVTEAAFAEMITQIYGGTEATDALTAFCRSVLDAAS